MSEICLYILLSLGIGVEPNENDRKTDTLTDCRLPIKEDINCSKDHKCSREYFSNELFLSDEGSDQPRNTAGNNNKVNYYIRLMQDGGSL